MTFAADFFARWRVRLGYFLAVIMLLLARPTPQSILIGGLIGLLGLAVRAYAAGYLHKQEILTTTGPYAYTRNPLYFGSSFLALGAVMAHTVLDWWSAPPALLFSCLQLCNAPRRTRTAHQASRRIRFLRCLLSHYFSPASPRKPNPHLPRARILLGPIQKESRIRSHYRLLLPADGLSHNLAPTCRLIFLSSNCRTTRGVPTTSISLLDQKFAPIKSARITIQKWQMSNSDYRDRYPACSSVSVGSSSFGVNPKGIPPGTGKDSPAPSTPDSVISNEYPQGSLAGSFDTRPCQCNRDLALISPRAIRFST